ncbi:MAG TPA: hypothetical protein VJX92_06635 [Methylomirabilota bacterium]|nr:hypothetical protein [Methylomirabilota bacterium]
MTNEATDDVSVVDLTSRQVLATIPVGNAPRKIAVQPGATVAAASPATATAASGKKGKTVALNSVTYSDHGTKDVRSCRSWSWRPTTITSRPPSFGVSQVSS